MMLAKIITCFKEKATKGLDYTEECLKKYWVDDRLKSNFMKDIRTQIVKSQPLLSLPDNLDNLDDLDNMDDLNASVSCATSFATT